MRADFHYTLTQLDNVPEATGACALPPRFNIAPGQSAPVIVTRDGGKRIEQLRWGLLPHWRGRGVRRGPLMHAAPLEAVAGTPLLRDSFKNRRCLVLADGCYAWRELKQPIWFHPEPRTVIAFAGVWDVNEDDEVASFAVLTGPPLVTRVNDAMPIVLDPSSYDAWLDPEVCAEDATELLGGVALVGWRADAVSTRMSAVTNDDRECIEPIGNPNQTELF